MSTFTRTESGKNQQDSQLAHNLPNVPATSIKFKHFFKHAFIGLLNDLNARLGISTYMLSTGDQRYWQGATQNLASTGSIDDMLIEAKNFVEIVPRCIVSIGSAAFKQNAITQAGTPARFIANIDNEPWSIVTKIHRLPVDFSVSCKIFASTWLLGLDAFEDLLHQLYGLNQYGFVWAGVIHGGTYEFDFPNQQSNFNILQDDDAGQSIIDMNLTLHLQYPAIDSSQNAYELYGVITDSEQNITVPDTGDTDTSGDDNLNIEQDITIRYNGGYDLVHLNQLYKLGLSINAAGNATIGLTNLNDKPICSGTSCKL